MLLLSKIICHRLNVSNTTKNTVCHTQNMIYLLRKVICMNRKAILSGQKDVVLPYFV